jgi:hypothetical protein
MEIEALRDRCRYWQKVLRLQDWDVLVEYKRHVELSESARCAETEYMWTLKCAKIALIDPVDRDSLTWFKPVDSETSLVHELIHLHFAPFEAAKGSDQLADQELAIEMIAEALVKLDRDRFGPEAVIEKPEPGVIDMLVAVQGNGTR